MFLSVYSKRISVKSSVVVEIYTNKPFVGHGKLRWIGNMLALWANMVLYFQKKVMMDLVLQIIIALNQLNVSLSFSCFIFLEK